MSISERNFRAALGRFASGVTVVTTVDRKGMRHGITVSAFCSVSLDPPLILICINKTTHSHPAFEINASFVVNVLSENQEDLSNHFASPIADKFDSVEYTETKDGIPVLKNALVNLECRLIYAHEGGDHTIFVGEIEKSKVSKKHDKPLIYYHGEYRKLDENC